MNPRIAFFARFATLALLLAGLAPALTMPARPAAAAPVETEIIGGKKVQQGADSFMVAIQFDTPSGRTQCSGSLLDATHVVTAGHCVTDGVHPYTDHIVFYGSVRFSSARTVSASIATPHPGYDPSRLRNDIAVLKLDAPVTGNGIGFIKLPAVGSRSHQKTGDTLVAAGWGSTYEGGGPVNDLRETTLPVYSFKTCKKTWGQAGIVLTSAHICAWGLHKDTCQGDSGGPIFARTANSAIIEGITSFGYGCATQFPGVYTRLSNPSIGNFVRNMLSQ